jgi:hypothetical protein
MAFRKLFEVDGSGINIEYWKIVEITINWADRTSLVKLAGYKDQISRQAGKYPLRTVGVDLLAGDFPFNLAALNANNPVKIAYAAVKAKMSDPTANWFADAEDVIEV